MSRRLDTAREYLRQLRDMQRRTGNDVLHLDYVASVWNIKPKTVRSRVFQIRRAGLQPPRITKKIILDDVGKRARSIDGYLFVDDECPNCNRRMVTDGTYIWCEMCGYTND